VVVAETPAKETRRGVRSEISFVWLSTLDEPRVRKGWDFRRIRVDVLLIPYGGAFSRKEK